MVPRLGVTRLETVEIALTKSRSARGTFRQLLFKSNFLTISHTR